MFIVFKIFGALVRVARVIQKFASFIKRTVQAINKIRDFIGMIGKQPGQAAGLSVKVEGIEQVQSKLRAISPDAIFPKAVKAAWPEIQRILQDYPPQRYVSREAAYGQTFSSQKQRRWFFAALRSGKISVPYHRTGELGRAWKVEGMGHSVSTGPSAKISNAAPGAAHVYGIGMPQAAQPRMVGWQDEEELKRRVGEVLKAEIERQIKKEWSK